MLNFLIVLFSATLLLAVATYRLPNFIRILVAQGLLLFGIVMLQLKGIDFLFFIFILCETFLFKAVMAPALLYWLSKTDSISTQEKDSPGRAFKDLLVMIVALIMSFSVAYTLADQHLNMTYFTVSIDAIFAGIFLIIRRHKLMTHLIGYLIIENGIFLLSLAMGSEMPMIVNTAILLDIITTILLFGGFLHKMSHVFKELDRDELSHLKD